MIYKWLHNQWDRTAAVVAVLVGAGCILAGWLGISRAALPTEQLPYLASGAVFGVFALGVGATLWLSADLRDEWRELHEIRRRLPDPVTAETDRASDVAVDLDRASSAGDQRGTSSRAASLAPSSAAGR